MSAIEITRRGGFATFLDRLREVLVGTPRPRGESWAAGGASRSGRRPTGATAVCVPAAPPPAVAGTTFAQALREDSNLEQDWLWFSTQVTEEKELRYCLERALYINPHSVEARRELARLARHQPAPPPRLARRGHRRGGLRG